MIPLLLLAAAASTCLPVDPGQERITGADLARAGSAAANFPGDTVFGYAPGPGVVKTFSTAALQRYARQYGVPSAPDTEICFVRPVQPLTRKRVEAALRESFGSAARIELLDFSKTPAPEGDVHFGGSAAVIGGVGLFRGYVRYGERQRFPLWAKARVEVAVDRPVAARDLIAGVPLDNQQITWTTIWEPPTTLDKPLRRDEVAGAVPRRALRAGVPIRRTDIQSAETVHRGDRVTIEAPLGNTRIAMEALAESGGRQGEWIRVRNPNSGKVIRALVVERGKAVVK